MNRRTLLLSGTTLFAASLMTPMAHAQAAPSGGMQQQQPQQKQQQTKQGQTQQQTTQQTTQQTKQQQPSTQQQTMQPQPTQQQPMQQQPMQQQSMQPQPMQQQPMQPSAPIGTTTTTGAAGATTTTGAPGATTTTTSAEELPLRGETTPIQPRESMVVERSVRPNKVALITGTALLAGAYVPTAIVAMTSGRAVEDRNLLIPVVGPWLNLADRRCGSCDNEGGNKALIIASGIAQDVGIGLAIASFFIPEKVEAATIQAGSLKMHVLPTAAGRGDGVGVGALGVF